MLSERELEFQCGNVFKYGQKTRFITTKEGVQNSVSFLLVFGQSKGMTQNSEHPRIF